MPIIPINNRDICIMPIIILFYNRVIICLIPIIMH
jgi:hypothetical protein